MSSLGNVSPLGIILLVPAILEISNLGNRPYVEY